MADQDRGRREHLLLLLCEATRDAAWPLHPCWVTLEMDSLFWVSRNDRAELHGMAGGTVEGRLKVKAAWAMTALSKGRFDWQIVVENGIQNILLS